MVTLRDKILMRERSSSRPTFAVVPRRRRSSSFQCDGRAAGIGRGGRCRVTSDGHGALVEDSFPTQWLPHPRLVGGSLPAGVPWRVPARQTWWAAVGNRVMSVPFPATLHSATRSSSQSVFLVPLLAAEVVNHDPRDCGDQRNRVRTRQRTPTPRMRAAPPGPTTTNARRRRTSSGCST